MSLTIFPDSGGRKNHTFSVRVRGGGGEWQELCVYDARNMYKPEQDTEVVTRMSYAYFDSDFSKPVEVEVTSKQVDITSAKIRPLSYGIEHTQKGERVINFTLNEPRKISVEINDNIRRNLHIFVSLPEEDVPNPSDVNVKYFGAGFHDVGDVHLKDGETVYIAGGALVMGRVIANDVKDVTVRGRGVLCGTNIPMGHEYMINFHECNNCSIDGIIIQDSPGWTIVPRDSENIHIKNVKVMNYRESSDGMNPNGVSNLLMEDVFLRIPDDCVSVKAYRAKNSNRNIVVKDSTFWVDAAHAVLIGPEGNGGVSEDITFDNIDILEVHCVFPDYYGVLAVTNGDDMTVRNVTFKNIRIENFSQSSLVFLKIEHNQWTFAPGKSVENILFKDIIYTGDNKNPAIIRGYDEGRIIRDVKFENFTINGKAAQSSEEFGMIIGDNAFDITFN